MSVTPTSAAELRRSFLSFFEQNGHQVVKSAPLIPINDPTLMFVNAGMVPFKDLFIGLETRSYTRASSCQKCMRVSGKHNDLEEVGRTARHQTLFEMLGNFSFGDYFKEEAIELAWKFLTEEMNIDRNKLWITVFGGHGETLPADVEAREIWKRVSGLGNERILDMGMKDNFWAMGDTGPCGPCTEIHYDTRPDDAPPPTLEDFETGEVMEIWNNVFMQFNRLADGSLEPLPKPSVDTGMGLERLATIMQGEQSNYHTDLFLPMLNKISALSGKEYKRSDAEDDVSMRVIADHARATAFLTADGIQPSNEGRGYVMRRIMRRAIRHGHRLGLSELFFFQICDVVVEIMSDAYPELLEARELITKVAQLEERNFRRTLSTGLKILEDELATSQAKRQTQLSGSTVFKLYDTYGFPKDLTEIIAQEKGLTIDADGFAREMEAQQERSRRNDGADQKATTVYKRLSQSLGAIEFIGYTDEDTPLEERSGHWRTRNSGSSQSIEVETQIVAIIQDGAEVESASAGHVELVLNPTPFYGESGGQMGDKGIVHAANDTRLEVVDSKKPVDGLTTCHARILNGTITKEQRVWAGYFTQERKAARAHHSATHLLHLGLQQVLGNHVKQAGSLVDSEHLRFDYSHFEAPTTDELTQIETAVNARVQRNYPVQTDVLPFDEAKQKGALALFGEKYGDLVRVITMGDSIEFCGGTHVGKTGEIQMVLITKEEAIASGVRRLEAECGASAVKRTEQTFQRLEKAASLLNGHELDIDTSSEPILAGIAKVYRTYRRLTQSLQEAGEAPITVSQTASAPTLKTNFGFEQAKAGRDMWQVLTRAVNTKVGDIEELSKAHIHLDTNHLLATFTKLQLANRANERIAQSQQTAQMSSQAENLLNLTEDIAGISVLATRVEGVDGKGLRELADQLRSKMASGVLCLGTESNGRANLLIALSKDLTKQFQAGALVKKLAPIIGGRGGGKPELAQGGGDNASGFEELFEALKKFLKSSS